MINHMVIMRTFQSLALFLQGGFSTNAAYIARFDFTSSSLP